MKYLDARTAVLACLGIVIAAAAQRYDAGCRITIPISIIQRKLEDDPASTFWRSETRSSTFKLAAP